MPRCTVNSYESVTSSISTNKFAQKANHQWRNELKRPSSNHSLKNSCLDSTVMNEKYVDISKGIVYNIIALVIQGLGCTSFSAKIWEGVITPPAPTPVSTALHTHCVHEPWSLTIRWSHCISKHIFNVYIGNLTHHAVSSFLSFEVIP